MLVPENRAEFLYPTFSIFIRGISTISFRLFSIIHISSLGTINCLLLSGVFLTLVLSAFLDSMPNADWETQLSGEGFPCKLNGAGK